MLISSPGVHKLTKGDQQQETVTQKCQNNVLYNKVTMLQQHSKDNVVHNQVTWDNMTQQHQLSNKTKQYK